MSDRPLDVISLNMKHNLEKRNFIGENRCNDIRLSPYNYVINKIGDGECFVLCRASKDLVMNGPEMILANVTEHIRGE